MKQTWQRFASKIDGLGLRERVFIFVAAVVILVTLVDTAALDPQFSRVSVLTQKILQDQSQIAGLQAEIRNKAESFDRNPDAAKLARLRQLKDQSDQLMGSLHDVQRGLVSPDRMVVLLEDILKQNGRLRLVSLRTLPVAGLNEPAAEDKSGAGKALSEHTGQKQADVSAKAGGASVDMKGKAEGDFSGNVLYKHGVEIVIEGDYRDMVNYMAALEAMPWRLFWGKARLTSDDSSRLSLTLTLYTLSLDKKWLNI